MKQLYVVQISYELVVVAESAEEASEFALEAEDDGRPDIAVSEMTYLPGEWDLASIPWGDRDEADPDRTVGKWIEMGAAPKLPPPSLEGKHGNQG